LETVQIPVDSFHATSGGHKMMITHEIHWIITIAPPRGNTMKFIRRPDLTPQTRIHIVMLAWLNQGVYGKMTQIAKAYRISRTLL